MRSTTFGASRLALLAFFATQFSFIISAPVAEPLYHDDLVKRSWVYPLKFGTPTDKFVMLSYTSITNTAGTVISITGDIGVTPAGTIVGITAANVTGTIHLNDAAAAAAMSTASAKCSCAGAALPRTTIPATSITALTFAPGSYYFAGAANLAADGTVTFDAGGNANAQFIMNFTGALTTGASSKIILKNSAKACNIFWVVGTLAVHADTTLGANMLMQGNICDYGAITAGAGVTYKGLMVTLLKTAASVISLSGGVFISLPGCAA